MDEKKYPFFLTAEEANVVYMFRDKKRKHEQMVAEDEKWIHDAVRYYIDHYNCKYLMVRHNNSDGGINDAIEVFDISFSEAALERALYGHDVCGDVLKENHPEIYISYFNGNIIMYKNKKADMFPFTKMYNPYLPALKFEDCSSPNIPTENTLTSDDAIFISEETFNTLNRLGDVFDKANAAMKAFTNKFDETISEAYREFRNEKARKGK